MEIYSAPDYGGNNGEYGQMRELSQSTARILKKIQGKGIDLNNIYLSKAPYVFRIDQMINFVLLFSKDNPAYKDKIEEIIVDGLIASEKIKIELKNRGIEQIDEKITLMVEHILNSEFRKPGKVNFNDETISRIADKIKTKVEPKKQRQDQEQCL